MEDDDNFGVNEDSVPEVRLSEPYPDEMSSEYRLVASVSCDRREVRRFSYNGRSSTQIGDLAHKIVRGLGIEGLGGDILINRKNYASDKTSFGDERLPIILAKELRCYNQGRGVVAVVC